ncbi:MAG: phosphatidylserine decarboxylase [Flavobacteriaceae bacterium]|nr:MAG: phosphatidylserine decarboxylase [Flavobacteriaceae bacterium]
MKTIDFKPVQIIDRKTGKKFHEKIPSIREIYFFYHHPFGKKLLGLMASKMVSSLGGWFMNQGFSKSRIQAFVSNYKVKMEEYIIPQDGFKSFNDFFYRKIKPEARPILGDISSPADGRVTVFPRVEDFQPFFVKDKQFTVSTFLDSIPLAETFAGGSMAIVRLAPVDYHRYHFPFAGVASESQKIGGKYYSVSPLALGKSLTIFLQNKREYTTVLTDEIGEYLFCDVGATMTGSIFQTYEAESRVEKGQEKGYFAFGGSTVVLFFQEGTIEFSPDLVKNTQDGFETKVLMGEEIARIKVRP